MCQPALPRANIPPVSQQPSREPAWQPEAGPGALLPAAGLRWGSGRRHDSRRHQVGPPESTPSPLGASRGLSAGPSRCEGRLALPTPSPLEASRGLGAGPSRCEGRLALQRGCSCWGNLDFGAEAVRIEPGVRLALGLIR